MPAVINGAATFNIPLNKSLYKFWNKFTFTSNSIFIHFSIALDLVFLLRRTWHSISMYFKMKLSDLLQINNSLIEYTLPNKDYVQQKFHISIT